LTPCRPGWCPVFVNEIKHHPGFTQASAYARLWEASGLEYPALCDRLVELAVERHERSRAYEF
jgi:D-alanine-D-alanine ligase